MELINSWDHTLFLVFNHIHNPFWDQAMRIVTHKYTWIPLYVFLIFIIIRTHKKQSIYILLTIGMLITLSDQISSGLLKPSVQRLRPCHEPGFQNQVHVVSECGGNYGFVSSHAANTFAIAMFLFLLFHKNKYFFWLFPWAMLVSYSRIYMGVHFPGDLLAGGMIGSLFGWIFYKAYTGINGPTPKSNA